MCSEECIEHAFFQNKQRAIAKNCIINLKGCPKIFLTYPAEDILYI
jgi:hypothetical protein